MGKEWFDSRAHDDAVSALHTLALPARVPVDATLGNGRMVSTFATPFALACLSAHHRDDPEQPLNQYARIQMPARANVLGSALDLPISELRIDPVTSATLNKLGPSTRDHLDCQFDQLERRVPVTVPMALSADEHTSRWAPGRRPAKWY